MAYGLERTQGTVSYAGVWGEYGDFRRLAKVVLPKELGRYHSEPTQTLGIRPGAACLESDRFVRASVRIAG
jgi:hypothetical protein